MVSVTVYSPTGTLAQDLVYVSSPLLVKSANVNFVSSVVKLPSLSSHFLSAPVPVVTSKRSPPALSCADTSPAKVFPMDNGPFPGEGIR